MKLISTKQKGLNSVFILLSMRSSYLVLSTALSIVFLAACHKDGDTAATPPATNAIPVAQPRQPINPTWGGQQNANTFNPQLQPQQHIRGQSSGGLNLPTTTSSTTSPITPLTTDRQEEKSDEDNMSHDDHLPTQQSVEFIKTKKFIESIDTRPINQNLYYTSAADDKLYYTIQKALMVDNFSGEYLKGENLKLASNIKHAVVNFAPNAVDFTVDVDVAYNTVSHDASTGHFVKLSFNGKLDAQLHGLFRPLQTNNKVISGGALVCVGLNGTCENIVVRFDGFPFTDASAEADGASTEGSHTQQKKTEEPSINIKNYNKPFAFVVLRNTPAIIETFIDTNKRAGISRNQEFNVLAASLKRQIQIDRQNQNRSQAQTSARLYTSEVVGIPLGERLQGTQANFVASLFICSPNPIYPGINTNTKGQQVLHWVGPLVQVASPKESQLKAEVMQATQPSFTDAGPVVLQSYDLNLFSSSISSIHLVDNNGQGRLRFRVSVRGTKSNDSQEEFDLIIRRIPAPITLYNLEPLLPAQKGMVRTDKDNISSNTESAEEDSIAAPSPISAPRG